MSSFFTCCFIFVGHCAASFFVCSIFWIQTRMFYHFGLLVFVWLLLWDIHIFGMFVNEMKPTKQDSMWIFKSKWNSNTNVCDLTVWLCEYTREIVSATNRMIKFPMNRGSQRNKCTHTKILCHSIKGMYRWARKWKRNRNMSF